MVSKLISKHKYCVDIYEMVIHLGNGRYTAEINLAVKNHWEVRKSNFSLGGRCFKPKQDRLHHQHLKDVF